MRYVIASRGSQLAIAQANRVQNQLAVLFPEHTWEVQTFTTQGDKLIDRPLSSFGGKGAFLKEIEEALLSGAAHLAVHSLKDVPVQTTKGLMLAAYLVRDDPRDVWVSHQEAFSHIPSGKRVGTSSLRREVLVRAYRSDLQVEMLRGNLDTRLRKLREGMYDGIVIAAAGLHRLGLFDETYMHYLSEDAFVPAPGQGVLVIQVREDASILPEMIALCNDAETRTIVEMEREFLGLCKGGCHLPVGAFASRTDDGWQLRALIGGARSSRILSDTISLHDPKVCAPLLFERLVKAGAQELLDEIKDRADA
jgi:hydroxymethylbilane synthase